jgi:hypothetical protein
MKLSHKCISAAASFGLATLALSRPAGADETVREEAYAPSTTLVTSGIVVFGLSYGTSVVIAASSGHDGDHHLYVPLAGPWLDIANRGSCPAGSAACDGETTNKILLGVDGVIQAVGALQILAGLLSTERADVRSASRTPPAPKLRLSPARIGAGYGVGAVLTM